MASQPLRRPHLLIPPEHLLGVLGELDVIRRVGIDEIIRAQGNRLKIEIHEVPTPKELLELEEVSLVGDLRVPSEGDIKSALPIEPTQTVVAGAVQIVEQPGNFLGVSSAVM